MDNTGTRLLAANAISPAPARRRPSAPASVFLPKEHGSWSLALEPLALALLLAPSAAGAAFALTVLAGFFARRPLKAAFSAQAPDRRRTARGALLLLATLMIAGMVETLLLGDWRALWPLLAAAPFGALFAYWDGQGDNRATRAELAGSATFAMLPAVFGTLAGWSAAAALSLAALALVRSVPTVLTIRAFLRQRKGRDTGRLIPLLAAGIGLALIVFLAILNHLPWLATAGAVLLLLRTAWLLLARPEWSARRAGITEAVLGVAYVAIMTGACAN